MAVKNSSDAAEPSAKSVTETITYVPGPMDPAVTKWAGHTFQANVPKEITGHPEGSERDKLNHQLIESARANKHFTVGSRRPKPQARELPKTAEQYRAYAVDWIKDPSIQHTEQLIARFAQDRDLQAACEVGADDYAWLATLFMPKLHELSKADELNENQVASIWINHGINQLPW